MARTRLIVVGSAAVLAVAIAGVGFAAGAFVFPNDPITRTPGKEERGQEVAAFPAQAGRPDAGVYVARTADGSLCVNSAAADERSFSGGCNPASDPLADKPFMTLLTYDGGPTVDTVREARLYGLADDSVKQLRVEMSDGSTRSLHLSAHAVAGTPYRVFAERVSLKDLRAGVTPVAVIAYDASGRESARQPTGLASPE